MKNVTTDEFLGMTALAATGFQFLASEYMTTRRQVRFPKSKKRRMRRKWARNWNNFEEVPMEDFYYVPSENTIVGHPATLAKLREAVAMLTAQVQP